MAPGDRPSASCPRHKFEPLAGQLGIRKVVNFYPLEDAESGLSLTGVSWQEGGTGDLYASVTILFDIAVGND